MLTVLALWGSGGAFPSSQDLEKLAFWGTFAARLQVSPGSLAAWQPQPDSLAVSAAAWQLVDQLLVDQLLVDQQLVDQLVGPLFFIWIDTGPPVHGVAWPPIYKSGPRIGRRLRGGRVERA